MNPEQHKQLRRAARAAMLTLSLGSAAGLTGCSGHGNYTKEGISLAQQRLNTLKAASEYDMAKQAFLAGDLDKAMRKANAATSIADESAPLHVLRGRISIERGNMGEALLALHRAAELDAESVEAAYYLGIVHERLDEREKALEHFRTAATLDPYNPQHIVAAGEMLIDLGRADEAETELLASDTARHAAGVQQLLGHISLINNQPAEACGRFGKARLLAPEDGAILEDLASAQIAAGRFADAEPTIRALLADTDNANRRDLLHMLAECLMATGQPVEARELYRGLVGPDENDPAAWIGLGRSSYALGDERTLRRAASRTISIAPRQAGGYVLFAVWSRDRGETTEALSHLDTGLMRAGPDAELLSLRALLLSELGRNNEALVAAQAAVDLDPDHTAAQALADHLGSRLGIVTSVPVD